MNSKIKTALDEVSKDIFPSEELLYSIKNRSAKEDIKMKKIKPIKIIVTCAIAVAALTAGVIGAGKVSYTISHSSHLEEINHFPTHEELSKIIDFTPAYTEKLGEYEFKSCVPDHSSDIDEDGNNLGDYTGINFSYKTDKGILSLSADPKPLRQEQYTEKLEYNGKEILYHSIMYKFVPPSYELTEEDKELQKKGELEISYGSDKVETEPIQSLLWESNGISYCLIDIDVQIDKNDFVAMAHQVIDAE